MSVYLFLFLSKKFFSWNKELSKKCLFIFQVKEAVSNKIQISFSALDRLFF